MQVHVKTHHIDLDIKGDVPDTLLSVLKKEFGSKLKIKSDPDEQLVDVFKSNWYKKIKKNIKPGDNLKIYREMHSMTQAELGKKLGDLPRQHISNMENGSRAISKEMAKKFAKLFNVSVDKFI